MSRIGRKLTIALALSFVAGVGAAQADNKDSAIRLLPSSQRLMEFLQGDAAIPDTPRLDPRYSWDEVERASVRAQRCGKQVPAKGKPCGVSNCAPSLTSCSW